MNGQQLKNSILQMAVQGKLVPQDPNDEPASVLLEKIRKEKDELINAGKIKKEKNPSYIFRGADNLPYEKVGKNEPVCIADEVPFEIPDSWEWSRLGSILYKLSDGTHSTPKYVESGIPFISVKDVSSGFLDFSNCKYISIEEHTDLYARCNPEYGDILLTKVGTTGIPVIVDTYEEFSLFVSVALLKFNKELLFNEFLIHLINSPLVQKQAAENTKGVGNKNWVMRDIANTLIVIPPLKEQQRIVSELKKYDKPLLDYNEKEKELSNLNNSFPELLKKSILQEAVQGKLVPQDPNDEPASVLLERIRKEKEKLVKEGKIKKDKNESIIYKRDNSHYEKYSSVEVCIDDEIPVEIPDTWEWCRLGNIAIVQSSKRVFEKDYVDEGIPFFRSKEIGDLHRGEEIHTQLFITKEHYEQLKRNYGVPQPGDILITSVGTIGNSWICDGREFYYKDGNITQICANPYLFSQYIQLFINSPLFIEQAQSTVSGTAYNALTIIKLKNMLIPVPPLLEQRRIVEKQRELFNKITLI